MVTHVNNIPSNEYAADMGSRTDVLFSTPCSIEQVDMSSEWPEGCGDECTIDFGVQGGDEVSCNSRDACWGLKSVIYRSFERDSCGGGRAFEWVDTAAKSSSMRFGLSADFVSRAVHFFKGEGSPYCCQDPSTGLHAAVTMALACSTVNLYGFRGAGTIDGHHGGSVGHGIMREHALLHLLSRHALPASRFPPLSDNPMISLWPYTKMNFTDSASYS